ncbi:MAG: hypothetical protein [Microviridae sp.]|nr:MAG: hypothetical protein [Microviridae sp.]
MAKYNSLNQQIPNKTPVEMPIGYERPESLSSMIARMIHSNELQRAAHKQGLETFEEADDFDGDDEGEMVSPYQMTDMQEEHPYVKPSPKSPEKPPVAPNTPSPTQTSATPPPVAPAPPTASQEAQK